MKIHVRWVSVLNFWLQLIVRELEVRKDMFAQRAIQIMVCIVFLGLISIFLYVGHVQISCGLLPTHFFL